MSRYLLSNPNDPNDPLIQKGQAWDEPIYKSQKGNEYFLLKFAFNGTRSLHPFDPSTGQIIGHATVVDAEWEGEPRVIGIDESTWDDLNKLASTDPNAEAALKELLGGVLNGDVLRLTRDGLVVGRVEAMRQGAGWALVKR